MTRALSVRTAGPATGENGLTKSVMMRTMSAETSVNPAFGPVDQGRMTLPAICLRFTAGSRRR